MRRTDKFLLELRGRSTHLYDYRSFIDNLLIPLQDFVPHDAAGITLSSGTAFDLRAIVYGYPPGYLNSWANRKASSSNRWQKFFSEGSRNGHLTLRSSEHMNNFYESDEYHELYKPFGLKYGIQTMFFSQSGAPLGLYACNRFQEPLNETDYSDEEKTLFHQTSPYIFRAFQKYRHLVDYDFFSLTSLDNLAAGVVVSDTGGRIISINSTAHKMFRDNFGHLPSMIPSHLKTAVKLIRQIFCNNYSGAALYQNADIAATYGSVICFRLNGNTFSFLPDKINGHLFFIDIFRINRSITATLSPREKEVIRYIIRGSLNKEIADILSISEKTVQTYACSIYQKLGVANRTEAAVMAIKLGLD